MLFEHLLADLLSPRLDPSAQLGVGHFLALRNQAGDILRVRLFLRGARFQIDSRRGFSPGSILTAHSKGEKQSGRRCGNPACTQQTPERKSSIAVQSSRVLGSRVTGSSAQP